ncbi:MAG: winged helix-turn-helix domain-containing protein, partial [Anaerolineae bacterium]|nr:winged helix-turn-helix domain-containing protein [Anaerolineae bacterium]
MHIRLLGEFAVARGDTPCTDFESVKVRALLAILAAEPGRIHTRAQLAGLLWGDLPESTAKQNLRQALFNLRQTIGDANADPPYLLISRHDIQINPAAEVTCDAAQLWQHLRQPTSDAAHEQHLLDLYRGKFLSSLFVDDSAAFEEWAEIQRESLHQRVLTALDKLAESALNTNAETTLNLAQRQLALDTWHEAAHRNLMRALHKLGRTPDALAQFAKCSQILQAELGVSPSAETIALYQYLRNSHQNAAKIAQTQAQTPAPSSLRPALPTPPTPFIGREREHAEALALLKDPACRLLSLIGPGGVGKTRLAIALAQGMPSAAFVGLATADASAKPAYAIAQAIAQTLKIPFSVESTQPAAIIQPLLNVLNGQTLTLVLDNIEHLIEGAGLLSSLLMALPQLKIIATSRERLNLRDEWAFALGGLTVPAESIATQDLGKHSATQLFLQAARRASGNDRLTADDARHIVPVSYTHLTLP